MKYLKKKEKIPLNAFIVPEKFYSPKPFELFEICN